MTLRGRNGLLWMKHDALHKTQPLNQLVGQPDHSSGQTLFTDHWNMHVCVVCRLLILSGPRQIKTRSNIGLTACTSSTPRLPSALSLVWLTFAWKKKNKVKWTKPRKEEAAQELKGRWCGVSTFWISDLFSPNKSETSSNGLPLDVRCTGVSQREGLALEPLKLADSMKTFCAGNLDTTDKESHLINDTRRR